MRNIIYTIDALEDIVHAVEYYHTINQELAVRFQREVDKAVKLARQFPYAWTITGNNTRRILLR